MPDQPATRQRIPTAIRHFHRHLIGRTAHATAPDFEQGLRVLQCLPKDVHGRLTRLFLDPLHRLVEDLLGNGLLPIKHQGVDELRDLGARVFWIRDGLAFVRSLSAWHVAPFVLFPGH